MDKKFANLNNGGCFRQIHSPHDRNEWNFMSYLLPILVQLNFIDSIYILLILTFILRLKLISLHNKEKKSKIILENLDLICGEKTSITAGRLKFRDYWIKQTYKSNYDKWIQNYYDIPVEYENVNQ